MREHGGFVRAGLSVVALALCMAVVGCIAFPTRMTTRRYGSGGAGLRNADVDLTFIKIGVTPRSEIAARLRAIDVNSPDQIFWGRWIESSWGVVGGSLPPLTETTEPAAGSARHWHYRNVLVKFDDQGIATEMRRIDNDEALWRELLVYTRSSSSAPVGDTVEISSNEKKYARMILAANSIELKAANRKDDVVIGLAGPVVIRLQPRFGLTEALHTPELTCFRAEITDTHARLRRTFDSCAPARPFIAMMGYLDRLPPPAKWNYGAR